MSPLLPRSVDADTPPRAVDLWMQFGADGHDAAGVRTDAQRSAGRCTCSEFPGTGRILAMC
jgi:hypothetical protein